MAQAKLTPDKIREENGLRICEKVIPYNARWCKDYYENKLNKETGKKEPTLVFAKGDVYKANRLLTNKTGRPKYVTVHNTGGGADAETYTRATWPNCNMGTVRVHYYVDSSEAWQDLQENEVSWHAANSVGNDQSLSIEIIMGSSKEPKDLKAEKNGAVLAAILLVRWNLPISALHTHYYWYNKKDCPVYIRPHWKDFVNKVQGYMNEIKKNPKVNLFPENAAKVNPPAPALAPVVTKPPVVSGGCSSSAPKPSGCSTSAPKCGSSCSNSGDFTYQNAYMPGGSTGSSCTPAKTSCTPPKAPTPVKPELKKN